MTQEHALSTPATDALPRAVAGLVVHSADDDADNPILPILVSIDGQPSGLGRALWTLVARHGFDNVLEVLAQGGTWTVLDPAITPDSAVTAPEVVVVGYGIHHPHDDIVNLARIETAMDADGVWWYVVERHGMLIDVRQGQHRQQVAFVAWADPEPQWADLDAAALK